MPIDKRFAGIESAIEKDDVEALKTLLQKYSFTPDIILDKGPWGFYKCSLPWLAAHYVSVNVFQYLFDNNVDFNSSEHTKETLINPLIEVCKKEYDGKDAARLEIAQMCLLGGRIDVNAAYQDEIYNSAINTALHYHQYGFPEMVTLLLANGAILPPEERHHHRIRRVVLFDVDDTLISSASLGDNERVLFFPETTKAVIDALRRDSYIIIASNQTPRDTIQTSLKMAGIDYSNLEILGRQESRQLPDGPYGQRVGRAVLVMERLNTEMAIIVDDNTHLPSTHPQVYYLLVPIPSSNIQPQSPISCNYLKASLLPKETLNIFKPIIQEVINTQQRGAIDHQRLNSMYDQVVQAPRLSGMSMQILGGFIAVLGIGAIAVAFVALNLATFGTAGIVVAGLGVAALLTGCGLFKLGYTERLNEKQNFAALSITAPS